MVKRSNTKEMQHIQGATQRDATYTRSNTKRCNIYKKQHKEDENLKRRRREK